LYPFNLFWIVLYKLNAILILLVISVLSFIVELKMPDIERSVGYRALFYISGDVWNIHSILLGLPLDNLSS